MLTVSGIIQELKKLPAGRYLYVVSENTTGMVNHYVHPKTFEALKGTRCLKELRHDEKLLVLYPIRMEGKVDIYPLVATYVYYYSRYFDTLKAMSVYKTKHRLKSSDMSNTFFQHELREFKQQASTLEGILRSMGLWSKAVGIRLEILEEARRCNAYVSDILPDFKRVYTSNLKPITDV